MENVMKIRRQILVDGRSIRSVARETGLSRITIRKYLADEEVPRYRRQKLDHPASFRTLQALAGTMVYV